MTKLGFVVVSLSFHTFLLIQPQKVEKNETSLYDSKMNAMLAIVG